VDSNNPVYKGQWPNPTPIDKKEADDRKKEELDTNTNENSDGAIVDTLWTPGKKK